MIQDLGTVFVAEFMRRAQETPGYQLTVQLSAPNTDPGTGVTFQTLVSCRLNRTT